MRCALVGHASPHELAGLAEADDARDVQRARAHAALVAAAVDDAASSRTRGPFERDVERADALRAVDLVRGERQQVDVHRVDVDRELADALRRRRCGRARPSRVAILPISAIGWIVPISLLAYMIETRIVLSVIALADVVGVDLAELVDRQVRDRRSPSRSSALQVSRMALCSVACGDDVVALLLVELGDALDRQVVRLGGAAREDDLLGLGADQPRRPARGPCRRPSRPPSRSRGCGSRRCRRCSVKYGSIASSTRGSTGVVAWLSM